MTERAPLPRIGVLLAGGASQRMGCDKATLQWQGKSLIENMLGILREMRLDRCVISGDRAGFASIPDLHPGRGPLGGLASVAMALPDATLLVVPIDMPCLTAELLSRLLDAAPEGPVHFSARPLPMRLTLDQTQREWFRNWLEDPNAPRAVHRLHQRLSSIQLAVDDADLPHLVNTNTPEEWERLLVLPRSALREHSQSHGCKPQQLVQPTRSTTTGAPP